MCLPFTTKRFLQLLLRRWGLSHSTDRRLYLRQEWDGHGCLQWSGSNGVPSYRRRSSGFRSWWWLV